MTAPCLGGTLTEHTATKEELAWDAIWRDSGCS
jgi:hypothetical protein